MERGDTGSAALAAAAPSASMRARRRPSARLFSVVLMAVFFIVMMIGLVAGVTMYRSAAGSQARAEALNLKAGLLANTVHANDAAGCVREGEGPEGPALVLLDRTANGTYETRLYLYHGHVVQEYAVEGRPYDPQGANELLESETFSFDYGNGLLGVTIDDGTTYVCLRSDARERAGDAR